MPATKTHHAAAHKPTDKPTELEKAQEENLRLANQVAQLELQISNLQADVKRLTQERDAKHQLALEAARQAKEAQDEIHASTANDLKRFEFPTMLYSLKPGANPHDNRTDPFDSVRVEDQAQYDQLQAQATKLGVKWEPSPGLLIRAWDKENPNG